MATCHAKPPASFLLTVYLRGGILLVHLFGSSFVTTLDRLFFSPFFWVSFLQSVFGRDQPRRFVSIIWLQGDGVLLSIL